MTERPTGEMPSLTLGEDGPLIGLFPEENGQEVVRYFTSEAQADAALSDDDTRQALEAIGSFSDLDWDEMIDALDRIRLDSPPHLQSTCETLSH